MATTNLGRVVPIDLGEYSASETYEQNHIVRYEGASYWHYSLQPTTGVIPTDTTVWRLVVRDGAVGSSAWEDLTGKPFESVGGGLSVDEDGTLSVTPKPYASLSRVAAYLYDVSFATVPPDSEVDSAPNGACSSYVEGGKLYRNLDLGYDERPSFRVRCSGFEGMAVLDGLTDTELKDSLIGQLPYHLTDGRNDHGIMASAHVLYNDWEWHGVERGGIPLTKLVYLILSNVKSMATLEDDLAEILPNLCTTPELDAAGYLMQFLVSDGETTCVILPPERAERPYQVVDATDNPKLTNFRWVEDAIVDRADLQDRPTGVERFNLMPCPLSDLRFTAAYDAPDRLSEFIGIDGTTKDSTDEELEAIYEMARAEYLTRTRDGRTWQTMHSVVYSPAKLESLCVQEDWTRDYASGGSGGVPIKQIGDGLTLDSEGTLSVEMPLPPIRTGFEGRMLGVNDVGIPAWLELETFSGGDY